MESIWSSDFEDEGESRISISKLCRDLGIKKSIIETHIAEGTIVSDGLSVSSDVYKTIKSQREKYVGCIEFVRGLKADRFDPEKARDRYAVFNYLDINDFFGVQRCYDNMLFGLVKKEEGFIERKDVPFLENKLKAFFADFRLSEREIIDKIFTQKWENGKNKTSVLDFMNSGKTLIDYTAALTEFVRIMQSEPEDLSKANGNTIIMILEKCEIKKTKEIIRLFNTHINNNRIKIDRVKKEKRGEEAYSSDEFYVFVKMVFDEEVIRTKRMVEKALENHLYAEMWLFLSSFIVCGWRGTDRCLAWKYLDLENNDNVFDIDMMHLKENILNGSLKPKYEPITNYIVKKINLNEQMPRKTQSYHPSSLKTAIDHTLARFFGRLILICEYHHFNSGEGYMKTNRIRQYTSSKNVCEFFGPEILQALHEKPKIKRLVKSYIQGYEIEAENQGLAPIPVSMFASYTRNHKNHNTTAAYLRDRNYGGKTQEILLHTMLERGVWGWYNYKVLEMAYPGLFDALSDEEQTKLMRLMKMDVIQMDTDLRNGLSEVAITKKFVEGNTSGVVNIINSFFKICSGCGKCKDEGVYCRRRASGKACNHPDTDSGIVIGCENMVFLEDAILSIVKKMKEYYLLGEEGDLRCKAISEVLYKRYWKVLEEAKSDMPREDQMMLEKLMEDGLNEQCNS